MRFNNLQSMTRTCGVGACLFAGTALGGISNYAADTSLIVDVTASADFNSLTPGQSLLGYEEGGLRTSMNRNYYSWDAPGLDGSEMFYASTGSLERTDITRIGAENFTDIDMQISSGWTPSTIGAVYLWVQLFDDGSLVYEAGIDIQSGDYVGLVGGGFDQILIGSYASAEIRDSRNPVARNAIAIDNISVGTVVPTPAGISVLLIGGGIGARRRQR
jgi:hypothetical protein